MLNEDSEKFGRKKFEGLVENNSGSNDGKKKKKGKENRDNIKNNWQNKGENGGKGGRSGSKRKYGIINYKEMKRIMKKMMENKKMMKNMIYDK